MIDCYRTLDDYKIFKYRQQARLTLENEITKEEEFWRRLLEEERYK